MRNNTVTLKHLGIQSLLQLSVPGFHVKTLASQIRKAVKELKENAADYGVRLKGLQLSLSPATYFLKILRSSEEKDSKQYYLTYPKSGMMRNGIVCEVATLVSPFAVSASLLLPTPIATDAGRGYSDPQALLNYLARGHQSRLIYLSQLAGMNDLETLELYREVMSFTTMDAKYTPLETQLCLL